MNSWNCWRDEWCEIWRRWLGDARGETEDQWDFLWDDLSWRRLRLTEPTEVDRSALDPPNVTTLGPATVNDLKLSSQMSGHLKPGSWFNTARSRVPRIFYPCKDRESKPMQTRKVFHFRRSGRWLESTRDRIEVRQHCEGRRWGQINRDKCQ
jgi:hypothetical protein